MEALRAELALDSAFAAACPELLEDVFQQHEPDTEVDQRGSDNDIDATASRIS